MKLQRYSDDFVIELWARWFSIYDRLPRWAQRLVPRRLR